MLTQGIRDCQHHRFGSADKGGVHRRNINPMFEQKVTFFLIHAPLKQINILRVAFQNMQDRQSPHELVFQILKIFFKHDRVHTAIGVNQREF